jgi:hypothetical protein
LTRCTFSDGFEITWFIAKIVMNNAKTGIV